MKIIKIVVDNYRSIQRVEIEPSRFSIFVGQNNHGKTNFFEAIEWFYNAKSSDNEEHFDKSVDNRIKVELHFDEVTDADIEKLSTDANRTKIRAVLDGATAFSVIKTSTDHKRRYFVNGQDRGNPQGLDTAINEFIPKLEYVNTKIRLDDVAKYKDKNPIGAMLSGVLAAIIETSEDYREFKEKFSKLFDAEDSEVRVELNRLGSTVEVYLQKQFPDGTKVKFTVNPPQINELLKSFDTSVNDGIETKAESKGDGMQRAIMLSIAQVRGTYGDAEAQTIVENCGNTLILRCSASENGGTAQFASRLIGEREIVRQQITENRSGGFFETPHRSVSQSEQHATESAVLASQVEQLADLSGYLKFASSPVWRRVSFRVG